LWWGEVWGGGGPVWGWCCAGGTVLGWCRASGPVLGRCRGGWPVLRRHPRAHLFWFGRRVGTAGLGGHSTELVCERLPACPVADFPRRYSCRLLGYGPGGAPEMRGEDCAVGEAEQA
jgi:hypothetical protein